MQIGCGIGSAMLAAVLAFNAFPFPAAAVTNEQLLFLEVFDYTLSQGFACTLLKKASRFQCKSHCKIVAWALCKIKVRGADYVTPNVTHLQLHELQKLAYARSWTDSSTLYTRYLL